MTQTVGLKMYKNCYSNLGAFLCKGSIKSMYVYYTLVGKIKMTKE